MVLIHKSVDINTVVPGVFEENVCIQVVENPFIGFTFIEGSESIWSETFVIFAYGPGSHLGDPRIGVAAQLVRVVPEPHFAVQFPGP